MAAPYKTTAPDNGYIRNLDGAFVPKDPRNKDYQDYQSWVAQGGIPDNPNVGNVTDSIFSNSLLKGLA